MKHAELLECLQGIKNRWWGTDGLSKLEELIRALKANPPLAEVEGWAIEPETWHEPMDVNVWATAEQAESELGENGAVPVTIITRKREQGAAK